jgi:hypothetical protein
MAEEHGDELAPAAEATGMALGPVFHDGRFKLGAGKQVENLAKMLDTRITAAVVLLGLTSSQRKP